MVCSMGLGGVVKNISNYHICNVCPKLFSREKKGKLATKEVAYDQLPT